MLLNRRRISINLNYFLVILALVFIPKLDVFFQPSYSDNSSVIEPWFLPSVALKTNSNASKYLQFGISGIPVYRPYNFYGLEGSKVYWKLGSFLGIGCPIDEKQNHGFSIGVSRVSGSYIPYFSIGILFNDFSVKF